MGNWIVCGGIWAVCASCALLFVRGAALANARSAELDDQAAAFERRRESGLRAASHASRGSLPRSAH
ncbi:MAG: hypothetical protein WDN30_14990 [Pararobbsia sp.]